MNWLKRFIARPWLTIATMHLYTIFGKPYFKVFVFQTNRIGNLGIDAHYNIHFIYELDNEYSAAGSDHYNKNLEQQAKIAIYLYDTFSEIAENYMPMEQLMVDESDIDAGVPAMGHRGGEEVRQVVDLADRDTNKSNLDIKMG